ncbi:MAG: DUF2628 domain-containing protein [Verrucomicrobia bacterium]|nr:DUF2628 domain-containing protein [Verrucomicrobiota bacterium]
MRKWRKRDSGWNRGINWAAFLFSGLWLHYRKMYVPAAIFLGVPRSVLAVSFEQ